MKRRIVNVENANIVHGGFDEIPNQFRYCVFLNETRSISGFLNVKESPIWSSAKSYVCIIFLASAIHNENRFRLVQVLTPRHEFCRMWSSLALNGTHFWPSVFLFACEMGSDEKVADLYISASSVSIGYEWFYLLYRKVEYTKSLHSIFSSGCFIGTDILDSRSVSTRWRDLLYDKFERRAYWSTLSVCS